jgi:hypothetical protein
MGVEARVHAVGGWRAGVCVWGGTSKQGGVGLPGVCPLHSHVKSINPAAEMTTQRASPSAAEPLCCTHVTLRRVLSVVHNLLQQHECCHNGAVRGACVEREAGEGNAC